MVTAVAAALAWAAAAGQEGPANSPALPAARDAVYRIDVNSADARWLEVLPGIGPGRAAAIVRERETGGPFRSVDDLSRVPGIGPETLKGLRGKVSLQD